MKIILTIFGILIMQSAVLGSALIELAVQENSKKGDPVNLLIAVIVFVLFSFYIVKSKSGGSGGSGGFGGCGGCGGGDWSLIKSYISCEKLTVEGKWILKKTNYLSYVKI